MDGVSTVKINIPLFLMSFGFMAMWISGFISTFISSSFVYLCSLYLFSLFLPAIGVLLFMKNMKTGSSRRYWGVPFLLGLFLITFLRDSMIMPFFYDGSFISTFDRRGFLGYDSIRYPAMIFFPLSSAVFCMSVPNGKRNVMILPFVLSIISALLMFFFFADYVSSGNGSMNSSLFAGHVIFIFLLGLSFLWLSVNYDCA
ncbi:MAG: hypothetical protein SCH66_05955 [Methanolobus sp.]|nr:hypothetical protein [Methanolobus sp.]